MRLDETLTWGNRDMDRKGTDLEDRLLEFAARVGKVVDALPETRLGRHVAGQLTEIQINNDDSEKLVPRVKNGSRGAEHGSFEILLSVLLI